MILKILKKMKHEYGGKWSSLKTATRFSPFSLVYGTKVISLIELTVSTPRVMLEEIQGDANDTHAKGRLVNLEGLEEK